VAGEDEVSAPIPMRRVEDYQDVVMPGDFYWSLNVSEWPPVRYIGIKLPGGGFCNIRINVPRGWTWDGNEDAPTLTPSIFHEPQGGLHSWHGFATAGKLVAA